ncbi:hypothetical protein P4119_17615 [Pseudomonas aeruginosa]|nr:hypothetical protein [Pseudomonas aeruginosa]
MATEVLKFLDGSCRREAEGPERAWPEQSPHQAARSVADWVRPGAQGSHAIPVELLQKRECAGLPHHGGTGHELVVGGQDRDAVAGAGAWSLDTPAIGEATSEIRTGGTHAQLQPATTTASAASSTATE